MRHTHLPPATQLAGILVAVAHLLGCLAGCGDEGGAPGGGQLDIADEIDADAVAPDVEPADGSGSDTADGDTADADTSDAADADVPPAFCPTPSPDPALERPANDQGDGTGILAGGRGLFPVGVVAELVGFPTNVVVAEDGSVAWVLSGSRDDRALITVRIDDLSVLQTLDRPELFYGIDLLPGGGRVVASGGASGVVEFLAVGADGTLTPDFAVDVGGYLSGLAASADGTRVFVGRVDSPSVVEIDVASRAVARRTGVGAPVWDVAEVAERGLVLASTLSGSVVSVVDRATWTQTATIETGAGPAGIAVEPGGDRAWVAMADLDVVAELDLAALRVVRTLAVTDGDLLDDDGAPLPHSNANDVALSVDGSTLFVSRGADNAVSFIDLGTGAVLGAVPTAWYTTGVAATPDGERLLVLDGKSFGPGPSNGESAKDLLHGGIQRVDLAGLDLEAASARSREATARPRELFPFECDGLFPVPTTPGVRSPVIDHVILIVKENKTFDCIFGAAGLDANADPAFVRWGEDLTPNLHALARAFNVSDNFYTEVENSDMGHILLTSGHLTEFVERFWVEQSRNDEFLGFQIDEAAVPEGGNVFTHLLDNDRGIRVYGEIVGMFDVAENGRTPIDYSDAAFPGGPALNYATRDVEKAEYVAERIAAGELAEFTYLLLPNDHTLGTRPGAPTPEEMVADNDHAVGIVVEALSRSPFWERSVVFILQDDPQGCTDHFDAHRSPLLVVSPWARRGYVSHVNYSFSSVFSTMFAILGAPPMGRPDAAATPMFDFFTPDPDPTPYTAIAPDIVSGKTNTADLPGAALSAAMDFRGPDRNPELGLVLDIYRRWRMGWISRAEADALLAHPDVDPELQEEREEEAAEEGPAYEDAFADYHRWRDERGLPPDPRVPQPHAPRLPADAAPR